MFDFEFVGPGKILFKEGGKVKESETLDPAAYEFWVRAKDEHARLIPAPFYRFMKDGKGPDWHVFDEERWEADIAPFIGERIAKALFPFQRRAIFKMVRMRRVMNACSPGLGKSIQALAALAVLRGSSSPSSARDLIVCPSYLRANWLNEVRKWLPREIAQTAEVIHKAGKKDIDAAARTLLFHKGIVIVSYDMLASILGKVQVASTAFNTAILDESHFVKDAKTKRFQGIAGALKRARNVFLLTGTPSPNRVKELYSQFSIIAPSVFFDYRSFALRYCDGHEDRWKHFDDRGSSNVDELAFMMSKLTIRLRREEHLSDLPAVMREKVILTPAKVSKSFQARKKKFLEELSKLDADQSAKFRVQTLASEMFRETAALKVGPVLEYMQGLWEANQEAREKVIFFCKHQTMMGPVTAFLEERAEDFIAISGATNMKERPSLIERFLTEPSCTYAVLTIGSCATGLNIVPVSRMVFLELDWSPSTLDQCECRINRIGGAKSLSYVYLVCQHTLDEMVFNKLKRKTNLASDVVDSGKRYGDFEFHTTKRAKIEGSKKEEKEAESS